MKFRALVFVTLAGLATYSTSSYAALWSELDCQGEFKPRSQVAPVYPRRAIERGIQGYIVMGFTINREGTTEDIVVVEADPETTFIRSATQAVEELAFPPCLQNGQAVRQANVSIKFDFNLE